MFLECRFDPVVPGSCPFNPAGLKKCIVPTTKNEHCAVKDEFFPAGTHNINNCGEYDVYYTSCGAGSNLVSNPCVT